MIELKITGQQISYGNKNPLVECSKGIYTAFFIFNDKDHLPSWSDVNKIAIFKNTSLINEYPDGIEVTINNNQALIPFEILKKAGLFYVGVFGANGDGSIMMPTIWAPPIYILPSTGNGR